MKYAIISDIHSNVQALQAVLNDIQQVGVDEIICLGDILGIGPSPIETLELVFEHVTHYSLGKMDAAIAGKIPMGSFAPEISQNLEWTASQLSEEVIEFLNSVPYSGQVEDVAFAHCDLFEPEQFRYLYYAEDAYHGFASTNATYSFIGNTHLAASYFMEDGDEEVYEYNTIGMRGEAGMRYMINVGSVGDPRDGQASSSYVILDTDRAIITFKKTAFDVNAYHAAAEAAGLTIYPLFLTSTGEVTENDSVYAVENFNLQGHAEPGEKKKKPGTKLKKRSTGRKLDGEKKSGRKKLKSTRKVKEPIPEVQEEEVVEPDPEPEAAPVPSPAPKKKKTRTLQKTKAPAAPSGGKSIQSGGSTSNLKLDTEIVQIEPDDKDPAFKELDKPKKNTGKLIGLLCGAATVFILVIMVLTGESKGPKKIKGVYDPGKLGFKLLYELELKAGQNYNKSLKYKVNNSKKFDFKKIKEVGYYLELKTENGKAEYVFVTMKKFGSKFTSIGLPTGKTPIYRNTNIEVYTNKKGMKKGKTIGYMEFWNCNYKPNKNSKRNKRDPGDNKKFDINDTPTPGKPGHGSMQIHDMKTRKTVMAISGWGNNSLSIGIGHNSKGEPDWTFKRNAKDYKVKVLRVFVK